VRMIRPSLTTKGIFVPATRGEIAAWRGASWAEGEPDAGEWLRSIANRAVGRPRAIKTEWPRSATRQIKRMCAHCGEVLPTESSALRRFCTSRCSMRAARRRAAGVHESHLPTGSQGIRLNPPA